MNSGTTETLDGIWGSGPDDVFAVGENGVIVHYDGTSWSIMNSGTTTAYLGSIWGSGSNNVYAVGAVYDGGDFTGVIFHYNGTSWEKISALIMTSPISIWGSGPDDIYVAGGNSDYFFGSIAHYDGRSWSTSSTGSYSPLYSVWGSSADNVYVVGDGGGILHRGEGGQSKHSSLLLLTLPAIIGHGR